MSSAPIPPAAALNDVASPSDKDKKRAGAEEEPREAQRKKVDFLLSELIKKFPPKAFIGKVYIHNVMYSTSTLLPYPTQV